MSSPRRRVDGVLLVPMDGPPQSPLGEVRRGSVRWDGDRITGVGALAPEPGEVAVDGSGLVALPGFVQGHVHLCQTLLRGLADDLPLMDWLRERIWPLEAAHDEASTRASAELAIAELLRGGTTTIQAIESVRHTEQAIAALRASGMQAIVGNCLIDEAGAGVPPALVTGTREALALMAELHASCGGAVQFAVSPRFVLSCSDALLEAAGAFAAEQRLRVHTHACEHRDEAADVSARFGAGAIEVLGRHRLLGPRTGLAHCVHVTAPELELLHAHEVAVLHCPSANLKLGSGIAPIAAYARQGLRVALGADGAPCNNRLSALTEMRLAALLQAVSAGPGAWPAAQALRAATIGGAEALRLDAECGSLTVGKRADLLLFDLGEVTTAAEVASALVYHADERQLRHVFVAGREPQLDFDAIRAAAQVQRTRLLARASL